MRKSSLPNSASFSIFDWICSAVCKGIKSLGSRVLVWDVRRRRCAVTGSRAGRVGTSEAGIFLVFGLPLINLIGTKENILCFVEDL
uniref:Uncharacterized protein n=1 Tax=Candidatus Kentrum sp. DK TaxID=2126562 RepID=A0A450T2V7_9GAMM|nr:MAG: hypothetical protein BECKDK2373C_GA0170839_108512 [Candidatus Kentron sp. DK]